MDFYKIKHRVKARPKQPDLVEVYPDFKVCRSTDLMVRAKSFYAVWDEDAGMWSTDEYDVQRLVDEDLYHAADRLDVNGDIVVKAMGDFSSKSWVDFRNYMSHISDSHHPLDECLTFSNTPINKNDYVSKRLPYPLQEGSISAYEELMSTLYEPEERAKLEWAVGSIIAGDSKKIQKFIVLYGEAGAGKSTFLNILQQLFEGYYTTFEAKALASNNNSFATEAFKSNPLVAIQHDGDLSKIEDNTKLNSIVSHEEMLINEKFKPSYTSRFNCFLFMATNRPVKITDAKSGLVRRLIDVKPSGEKIPFSRYQTLMAQVSFELGAIAYHCLKVYEKMGKHYYSAYRPIDMMFKTDVFFNFVEDSFYTFREQDGVTLKAAFTMYKEYCEDAKTSFVLPRHKFREELKNYFEEFYDLTRVDGKQVRSYFSGFKAEMLENPGVIFEPSVTSNPFQFESEVSLLDDICSNCLAQYASESGIPQSKWVNVETTLKDIDTRKLHYLKLPENHIVIDFDIKGEDGSKSLQKNLDAVAEWPPTYAELSKSGEGIHLHYIYNGDATKLSRLYSENIEIKVFSGNSSLRRKLTKCNDIPVATIDSGLPLKKEKKMINFKAVQSEKGLRTLIKRNLNKEIHPGTKPSIDFIYKILEDAYKSGMYYDVCDLRPKIQAFANNSTNQADYCLKLVEKMHFQSDEASQPPEYDTDTIIFYDVEVFPNLFLVNWKVAGSDQKCVRMINPTPTEIEELLRFKLVGFNCRRYDNHIMYARYLGYNNEQLYQLSQKIISGSKNAMFKEAYNISYTDVYDFASAGNKKSLKKWEIDLGIHHQELGLPWDKPVPEDQWILVAEYCDNDVIATEAVFNHLKADWMARKILADIADMTVNDTTNQLSTKIIFGRNREPQNEFNYRNLAEPVHEMDQETLDFLKEVCPTMMSQLHGEARSLLPYFPGYKFRLGKSIYQGEEVGEGGYVYSEPGMYTNVALLDITSMHPHSIISECLFGARYTKRFFELVYGRVDIKHEEWDEINHILDGKLSKYVKLVKTGELSSKDLANGLKTAINSVYGLTSAKFVNPFKDPRNKDNIVAKRGALFMVDLKKAVQEQGYTVAHIKTDSIKIPNADQKIIDFVCQFGEKYGYHFEHEATYEKMCLVNDAVYIAKYPDENIGGYRKIPWVAVGAQFQHPYVFKTLFSKEPIEFSDVCETKSVKTALYLDLNEDLPEGEHNYIFVGKTGCFCPVLPGTGGGLLLRESGEDKYAAATGSKGYRWREAEMVQKLDKIQDVDRSYFNALVDDAIENISKYGDFEWFSSEKNFDEIPPWENVERTTNG